MRRRLRRAARRHAVARDARARPRGAREPRASRRRGRGREHRRRRGHPRPGARRVLPRGSRRSLPRPGRYGVAVCFLPHEPARRAELEHLLEATVAEEGQSVVGWRDVPVDARHVGGTAGGVAPLIRQLFVAAAPELDDDAFERKLYVIRRRAELAAGPELVVPSFSARTGRLQGDADRAPASRLLPRPARRALRERARARALALLDEHVPELGARAPVPADRAQRRDQHGCRATSTGCARASRSSRPSSSATTSARCCRSFARPDRTRRCSTTCSSCCCSRAARSRTR